MKPVSQVFGSYGTTIFEVMSRLADAHKAINLGQGFPDDNGPDDVREVAAKALCDGPNQYPPMAGIPALRDAVAQHAKRFYGLAIDGRTQVMVTSGATEALAASLLGLLNPGDEAIVIEPLYDSYVPIIRAAGATARSIRLSPPSWDVPFDALGKAVGPRTKLLLINNPMNPAGKVFTRAELEAIAAFCVRHDLFVVCDEVYEHIVFSGATFIPMISLPGMAGRAVRIGSAGKTFSLTGWKVGYVTAAPEILASVAKAHQFLTFTTAPNLQAGVAYGLAKDDSYFAGLARSMEQKRDRLADGLRRIGFEVARSDGTYFINADFRPLGFNGGDEEFCRMITEQAGVAAVPVSAFYLADGVRHYARFCFCKRDAILDEAIGRLARHFGREAALAR
ncbi:MAG: aminotransferase [Alphaproteobacteria bacterium]